MGEAKRRRKRDPNFGRVPKQARDRGLVISPPIVIEGNLLIAKSSSIDPQELRFALTFWDRLAWPSTTGVYLASNTDESFLEEEKVLTRPHYNVVGDLAVGFARAQLKAYEDLDSTEPGVWAMAQGENSFLWKEGLADENKGATVQLFRAIPIPKHDVPLAEILEFKKRRSNELLLLRYHLESFASNIERAEDKSSALQKWIAEVDAACADLIIVAKEWLWPVYLSNVKASMNITASKFGPWMVGGWGIGEIYNLGAATAAALAVLGGAVSAVELKSDFGFRTAKMPVNPYRYVSQIDRELR